MRVQFKHILCATDFSDFSNHTIGYGVALAKEFEAKLFVSHVIDAERVCVRPASRDWDHLVEARSPAGFVGEPEEWQRWQPLLGDRGVMSHPT